MKEGWVKCTIGDIYDFQYGKGNKIPEDKGQYLCYGSNGIVGHHIEYNSEDAPIIGHIGAYAGIVNWGVGKHYVTYNGVICKLKNDNVDKMYGYYLLKSQDYMHKIRTGMAQPFVSYDTLKAPVIFLPPLSEQSSIVSYLDTALAKIDALKSNAEKELEEAKALFQSALKEMMTPKEGWEMKKVGGIFDSYAGGTPLKQYKEYYEGGNIPWLRSGEVCRKYITETEMFITQQGLDNSSAKYYPVNTVVIAMYGATAAQVGILKIETTSNQAVCGLLPNKKFLPEFVYYWFTFIQEDLASQAQGGAQPNISQVKIKNVLIPEISLEEQKRIVDTIEILDSKIQNLQSNYSQIISECSALKQAILRDVFE